MPIWVKVNSWGYELSLKWGDKIGNNARYWVEGNLSYNQNEIKEMYEAPQNYDYMYQKGHRIGSRSIRKFWGLYDETADARYYAQYGKSDSHPFRRLVAWRLCVCGFGRRRQNRCQ